MRSIFRAVLSRSWRRATPGSTHAHAVRFHSDTGSFWSSLCSLELRAHHVACIPQLGQSPRVQLYPMNLILVDIKTKTPLKAGTSRGTRGLIWWPLWAARIPSHCAAGFGGHRRQGAPPRGAATMVGVGLVALHEQQAADGRRPAGPFT